MSISYSNDHSVQVTLLGVSDVIPTNSDYRYVIPGNFALDDPNISFDSVKDEYYRKVLSDLSKIGSYTSGVDYKHYDDPRCRCILCWTHRTNLAHNDLNIPTVKAKFLFVLDQLRSEKFQFNSYTNLSRFESIMYRNYPGITKEMINTLWHTLFRKTKNVDVETFDIESELDQIISGFDIVSLRKNDIAGQEYPMGIQNSIKELQSRIDKDYKTERRNNEICDMTENELVSKHVKMLKNALYHIRKRVKEETKNLNDMWKDMFVHDFIMDNIYSDRMLNKISENRVKKTKYPPYRDASTVPQKTNILSVKLREFESAINAEKKEDYFTNIDVRNKIREAYIRFNKEFTGFLYVSEKKDVKKLLKSEKIKTSLSLSFKTTRKKYELTFLEQKIKNLKDVKALQNKTYNDMARDTLKLVRVERDIHKFGFKSNGIPRINCKKELRGYIENAWNRMRTGQVAYTKDGKEYTPEDFKKRENALYAEKLEEYAKEYADARVFSYYLDLPLHKRERVNKKWTHYQLRVASEFYNKNGLNTNFRNEKENIRKFWEKKTNYRKASPNKQKWLDSTYYGKGGYEEQERLKFMKWEISAIHKKKALWTAVFWFEVQKKEKRFLWQVAREEYGANFQEESAKRAEIADKYTNYLKEASETDEILIRLRSADKKSEALSYQTRLERDRLTLERDKLMEKLNKTLETLDESKDVEQSQYEYVSWLQERVRELDTKIQQLMNELDTKMSQDKDIKYIQTLKDRMLESRFDSIIIKAKDAEKKRTMLRYEAKAEMYLTFDIFGGGEVDDNKLDTFILNNLPKSERNVYQEVERLKALPRPHVFAVQERINYIRYVYKKKVFDREIRKRALILPLKRLNDFVKEAWTDAFDRGEIDEQDMTDWQRSLRLSMDQHRERNEDTPFPYGKDWVSHKYLNIRKWLTKDTKVYVLCKYKELVTSETPNQNIVEFKLGEPGPDAVMTGDDGYWVEKLDAPVDMIKTLKEILIDSKPKEWKSKGETEDLKMAWVEEIHPDSVTVRFENPFTIEKRYMVPKKMETARISLKNVFDNKLDYNVVRERTAEEQQKEEEKRKKAKMLADKDRERRILIRNIVHEELIQEQKEQKEIEEAAEDALRMYDESRKDERYQFFIKQKNKLVQAYSSAINKTIGRREAVAKARNLGNEFKKEDNFVQFVMFERGRQQWLDEVIGGKRARIEGSDNPNMRTRLEQVEKELTDIVMRLGKHVGERANSNRMTYEYRRMMYVYGKNSDESIRLFLLNKLEPANNDKKKLSPGEKKKFLEDYKKDMIAAIKRDDEIHKYRNKWKYSRLIKERRERIMRAIQDVMDSIDQQDEDERLVGQDSEIKEYILTGRLDQDVNFRLKTPKLLYTDEMWKSELETSLEPLDNPTFGELLDYVTKTKLKKYLKKDSKRGMSTFRETEYQRDFKTKNSELMPVYPTPSNRTLQEMADNFKPPVINDVDIKSEVATNVRIGMGPGAWFEINKRSELMRQTDMTMEDRLLFAKDVESFQKEENPVRLSNEKNTATRNRMANILVNKSNYGSSEWIESDGDGSIRVLDDLIGEFTYNEETLQSVRISGQNDVPTHVRLNTIYFDTVRGTETNITVSRRGKKQIEKQNVRRLVPFYVVSLYRKEGTSYKRLKVRNRADKTFLPRQNKHAFITKNKKNKDKFKRIYTLEDYRGYACSVCLNEEEFQSLVNPTQLTSTDRRIVQIPGPFLYKYHKIRFERERVKMELLLIERKKNGTAIRDEIVSVGDPDDLSAPFSDGMIRLGGMIKSMKSQSNIIRIGGFCLDEDGNKVPDPGVTDNREIHSNDMYAAFEGSDFYFGGDVVIYTFRNNKWNSFIVKKKRSVRPILKWSEDILLVASHTIVEGFDTKNNNIRTLFMRGHSAIITCMSVNRNHIVTGSNDKTLIVWNNKTHPIERKSRVLVESGNRLRFGNVVRVEEQSCEVELLKIPGKQVSIGTFACIPTSHISTLYGHSGEITSVVWGKHIVSSSNDKTIIVWDNGQVKYRLDFTILKLFDPVIPKGSYRTTTAPYIALVNSRILFYGIGNILGKANIETGKRVPFDNAIVNIVSELPIRTSDIPMPKMPSRVYFDDLNVLTIRTDEEMRVLREKRNEIIERTRMSMEDKYPEGKVESDSSDEWVSDDWVDSSESKTFFDTYNVRDLVPDETIDESGRSDIDSDDSDMWY